MDVSPPPEVPPAQRQWAAIAHLASFTVYLTGIGFIIGPLVVWIIKKNEMEFVDDQGKEAINFNISVFIYAIVSGILALVLIGFLLLFALGIFHLIMVIVAAINANNGMRYRYPLTIRFIK